MTDTGSLSNQHIRGSGLLFAGRLLTLVVGFAVQVVIVRYLAKSEFGALSFALSTVSLASSVAAFGLDKATSRFVPIYQEQGDRGRVIGLLVLAIGTMTAIAAALVLLAFAGRDVLAAVADEAAVPVVLVLMLLTPVQALDPLVTALLSALGMPKVVFLRRYVIEPVFEVTLVTLAVLASAGVLALATGYVVIGIAGLVIYAVAATRVLRRRGYLSRDVLDLVVVPWREVLSFSVPLLSSDLVFVLRGALVVVLLQIFASALEVADFRAVFPQARLNLVVLQSFTFLYLPLAARLHARDDREAMSALHLRSTSWVAWISFPLFAISLVLAEPLVVLLYGEPYASTGPILAILSTGFFASAVLGFGGLTLRAVGTVRYIVGVDLLTAAAGLVAYVLAIPAFGAVGAATITAGTLIAQGIAYLVGLHRAGLLRRHGEYVRLLVQTAVATAAVAAVQSVADPPLWAGVLVVAAAWLVLLWLNRGHLDIGGTFPEVRRVPVVGALVAARAPDAVARD